MNIIAKRIAALLAAILLLVASAGAEEMNVLLIGLDTADDQGRSDTMLLARIQPQEGTVQLVSFLRDLYVPIPGHGSNRLNAAYFYGGEELLCQTLSQAFDVSIHRWATVHFSTLKWLVDELGGVTLEVSEAEQKQMNQLLRASGGAPLAQSGTQLLNGSQALAYSRIRKQDSDFHRTRRQQALLLAMLPPMSRKGPFALAQMAITLMGQIDTNLTLTDLATLFPLLSRLDSLTIQTAQVPFSGAYQDATVNGMMVLNPDLKTNRRLLREFWEGRMIVSPANDLP